MPEEHDSNVHAAQQTIAGKELLAEWLDVVHPFRRGLISKHAFLCHAGKDSSDALLRFRMEIAANRNASIAYDLGVLFAGLRQAAQGKLRQGSNPIIPNT